MIHPIALWRMAKHWAVPAALLLAIALVGAWIWSLNAERTRLIAWGERTCLAAGALFEEPGRPARPGPAASGCASWPATRRTSGSSPRGCRPRRWRSTAG